MVWLPWKSKKKALETGERDRKTQDVDQRKAGSSKPSIWQDGRGEPSSPAAKTEALARPDALLTPSYRGDAERVAELIKLKADLHATDALGNCPLHLAAFNGHIKVISLLLDAGANPCHQNGELDTPVYMSVLSNNLQCVKLVSTKVSEDQFNSANIEGFTPLHYAAGEGNLQICQYLVETCNCDPQFPDNLGLTPGFCAVLQGRKDVAEYLLQRSPDSVHSRNMASDTMLHCAIKAQPTNTALLKMLIDCGADVSAKGADQLTCEDMLISRQHQALVEYSKTLTHNQKEVAVPNLEKESSAVHLRKEPSAAHPSNVPFPWLRKYIADKIDSRSEMPAKPIITPENLQEEWEFARKKK